MKKFEDIWKKANEEADSKYEPRGTLAWGVFLKEALEKRIEPLLEKQQPEIPEVPQFVADWYEENKGSLDYMIFETCRDLTDESTNEFENWFGYDNNKAITTLVNMKNGYTVKDKRFYLKNKLTGTFLYRMAKGTLSHQTYCKDSSGKPLDYCVFTQQEIDSMETGSYEQIEVQE